MKLAVGWAPVREDFMCAIAATVAATAAEMRQLRPVAKVAPGVSVAAGAATRDSGVTSSIRTAEKHPLRVADTALALSVSRSAAAT